MSARATNRRGSRRIAPRFDAVARDLGAERLAAETEAGRTLDVTRALEDALQGFELAKDPLDVQGTRTI